MSAPRISIAICTYDRYALLAGSIADVLAHCPVDGRTAELVVVENTIPEKRRAIPLEEGPGRRVVICEATGLANARNAAIAATDSEFIVFLDDDAFVRPGWVEAYLDTFDRIPEALVVGGRCHARYEMATLPSWFDKKLNGYLSCIDWGDEERFITPAEWVVGANVAFRRSVFETYGAFDPSLGRKGAGSLLSNEETALMDRIGRQHIFYQPCAEVDHFVPADRISLAWFRKRVFWQAVSDILAGTPQYTVESAPAAYDRLVIASEPQYRNIDIFSHRPRDFTDFERQLQAIYVAGVMGAEGYRGRHV
jgi:glycosyltransferase involved in cell wall biosynthesis